MITIKEDMAENTERGLNSKIKDQSGFALLIAMSMMIAVSLVILRLGLEDIVLR